MKSLFANAEATNQTRLNEAAAHQIASNAAIGVPGADRLVLRGAWTVKDRIIWHFWTPTKGSGLLVTVDDADDETVVERFEGR